ncbi:MAG TPA: VTT domain-containing protein [Bryobacteraceae bacterium]
MKETLDILARHGYWVLFLNVLAEQIGVPVPALPVLFGMGSLAAMHRFSFSEGLGLAVIACLISDTIWYGLGRVKGQSVLKTLCRISLEPESCVSLTKGWFEKYGSAALLFSKFVPGLSTVAQPLAGANKINLWRFLLMDGLGSLIWASVYLGLGWTFHDQAAEIWAALTRLGGWLVVVAAAALALYLLVKYWRRVIYIRGLRGNRITPADLKEHLESPEPPVILDLRGRGEVKSVGMTLPGAHWVDVKKLKATASQLEVGEIPEGREIVLFCS